MVSGEINVGTSTYRTDITGTSRKLPSYLFYLAIKIHMKALFITFEESQNNALILCTQSSTNVGIFSISFVKYVENCKLCSCFWHTTYQLSISEQNKSILYSLF